MSIKFAARAVGPLVLPGLAILLLVSGCGETRTQRAATGALGGAVAGEVIADEPLAGAAIGGVGGALIR